MVDYLVFAHNVSLEPTGDPAKNVQGERCGAICKPLNGRARQEFSAGRVAPAPQFEVVSRNSSKT
jgi:hypothetical protein